MERLGGRELVQKASQLIASNKLDEAVKIFDYLVVKIPDAPLPLLSRCTWYVYMRALKKYETAKKDAEKLLSFPNMPIDEELAPGNSTLHSVAYVRLAKCYKELGQIEEAEKLLKKRLEIEKKTIKPQAIQGIIDEEDEDIEKDNERSEKLRLQGNELYKLKKYKESSEIYSKALELDPNDILVHSNKAQVLLKLNELNDALIHAEECIRINTKWPKGYYRSILLEQKKYGDAFAALQLAKHYGAKEADLSKKIDLSRKQIKNATNSSIDSSKTFPSLKSIIISSIAIVIISILFLYFEQIKDIVYWSFNIYFEDLW
ncbi:7814_t:CDS:2 [Funneliformis caledonium]|uniref:7814_t:CDS:1 n=1 Tax=Funneliformis caledonium TaxID=1117310 RepID=A0A9N8VYQ7_9GLOM|nr:7814_t:CDS:2 [Funneliformis caledonium]